MGHNIQDTAQHRAISGLQFQLTFGTFLNFEGVSILNLIR